MKITLPLKLAERGDFNYCNKDGAVKARHGFFYWEQISPEDFQRNVFSEDTDRDLLRTKINSGKIYVAQPEHTRDHLAPLTVSPKDYKNRRNKSLLV